MNLIHRVGAGLIVVVGVLPVQAQAQWPAAGCGCNSPAPMAQMPAMAPLFGGPMFAPEMMAPQTCGAPAYGPRMRAPRMQRPWVYHSRTRIRMPGQAMFGDATMGLGNCECSQPSMMMPQVAPMIVPQQSMCPQQVVTYREVPKTIMRQEAVQVQIPTTTYKQMTVDEGGYQQVWVPRMVTKNVPQTIMQTQVQYRQVPQTVVERVPQVTTQWLPQTITPIVASSCGPGVTLGGSMYPIATPTTVTPVPDYYSPAPMNPVPVPTGDTANLPTPVAPQTSQVQEWQKVRQRSSTIQQQAYAYESQDAGYRVPQAAGRFSSKR